MRCSTSGSRTLSILRQKVASIEIKRRINSNNSGSSDCTVRQKKADGAERLQGKNIAQCVRQPQASVDCNKCSQSYCFLLANAFAVQVGKVLHDERTPEDGSVKWNILQVIHKNAHSSLDIGRIHSVFTTGKKLILYKNTGCLLLRW